MTKDKTAPFAYAVIASLLLLLAYPALVWLVRSWLSSPYYSHGFLVPPIAGLLAWRQWRHLRAEPRQGGRWAGMVILLLALALIVWTMRWQNYFGAALGLVALLLGILVYLEGWPRARYWFFPLFFLIFMIPLPFIDLASPWLEAFTARWATVLAGLGGITALQQGGEITLPNGTITVGAPCSGLRSLVAMTTLVVGWVYLVDGRLAAKGLLLAAAIPLVAFSNVVRITLLLVLAAVFGQEAALAYYHDWSSPLLFLLAVGLLLVLGKVLGCSRVRDDIF